MPKCAFLGLFGGTPKSVGLVMDIYAALSLSKLLPIARPNLPLASPKLSLPNGTRDVAKTRQELVNTLPGVSS